ncbi:fumarylacetoacetate hydrolase family protein [Streptomyces sp. T028]|uniref:fumarylacetoacetate hydrolase family protein n=1 Tax=Streptomyces sp. T028 TaxID=3394379 RepID=UPI003A898C16
MRVINHGGRAGLEQAGRWLDVEIASDGWFTSDPMAVYARWDELRELAREADFTDAEPVDEAQLGAPVPRPRQIFAVGLNYRAHARESGLDLPEAPFVFTKFPASVTGPYTTVELPTKTVMSEPPTMSSRTSPPISEDSSSALRTRATRPRGSLLHAHRPCDTGPDRAGRRRP